MGCDSQLAGMQAGMENVWRRVSGECSGGETVWGEKCPGGLFRKTVHGGNCNVLGGWKIVRK